MFRKLLVALTTAILTWSLSTPAAAYNFDFQVIPTTGYDLSLESRFEFESPNGKFAIIAMLPKNAVCPRDPVGDGPACSVMALARIETLGVEISLSSIAIVAGEVLDESLADIGDITTSIRPADPRNSGYKTTYRRLTVQFEKRASGFVTVSFDELTFTQFTNPDSRIKVTRVGAEGRISVKVLDNQDYLQFVDDQQDEVVAKLEGKKFKTICKKGKVSKTLMGKPGVCPKGYVNPLINQKSYQVFLGCKLFQKGNVHTTARLSSSGKILELRLFDYSAFTNLDEFWGVNLELTKEDYECVMTALQVPQDVLYRISVACDQSVSGEFKLPSNRRVQFLCDPRLGQTLRFS